MVSALGPLARRFLVYCDGANYLLGEDRFGAVAAFHCAKDGWGLGRGGFLCLESVMRLGG